MFVLKLVLSMCLVVVTHADNNTFEAVFERAELVHTSKEYATVNFKIPKIYRTTYALSGNITIFKDLPADAVATGMVYVFYSNQYRRTAAAYYNMNLCHLIDFTRDTIERFITPYGNMPRKCPIQKGFYYLKEYMFSTDSMENLPWNKIKTEFNISLHKELLFSVAGYFTLDRDIMFRRPFMNNMNLFQ